VTSGAVILTIGIGARVAYEGRYSEIGRQENDESTTGLVGDKADQSVARFPAAREYNL